MNTSVEMPTLNQWQPTRTETTDMLWPQEGEDTTKKMVNMQVQGNDMKGEAHEKRHGVQTNCAAHEDKGRLITTWRRVKGEKK